MVVALGTVRIVEAGVAVMPHVVEVSSFLIMVRHLIQEMPEYEVTDDVIETEDAAVVSIMSF